MKRKNKWIIMVIFVGLLVIATGFLFYNGVFQINNPSTKTLPVRGVDVSSYQGEIDWDILSNQGIDFAYIKATEGSSYVDACYAQNWEKASETHLKIGAYHFFSFESLGEDQARHIINTVPQTAGTLPVAVDLEFYGAFHQETITDEKRDEIKESLDELVQILEAHYGVKPVLYVTEHSYQFFQINPKEYRLWVRSVYSPLRYCDADEWLFWQYSNRKRLKGYYGIERYIDMNTYSGSLEELEELLQK